MSSDQIERAWKDKEYRGSLTDNERSELPDHPSGAVELPDAILDRIGGGTTSVVCWIGGTASAMASCSINCDTVVRGSCGAFSYGCCPAEQ
jgi:mersacidin/lichenicidin family type 2 lantibiotic